MSKIILEIEDKELLELGKEKIKEELEHALKLIKLRGFLKENSNVLNTLKIEHEKIVKNIKEETWQDYKKDLPLQ